MTAKQYLNRAHRLRRRMAALELEEEKLRTQVEGLRAIVYDKDRVQTSVVNRFNDLMADLIEIEKDYARTSAWCAKYVRIIEDQISALDNDRHVDILRLRYIEEKNGRQMTIEEIRKEMKLSYDRARHLHGEAIRAFDKKYHVSTH